MGDSFSAAGSLAGYLWQLRQALIYLLRLDPGESITIEREDDICHTRLGAEHLVAIQAKHSFSPGKVTTRSADLWKTLRVWTKTLREGKLAGSLVLATSHNIDETLNLFTTDNKKDETSLAHLEAELSTIAHKAENKKLSSSFSEWLKATKRQRIEVLRRIKINPCNPVLSQSTGILQAQVRRHHIPKEDCPKVATALEGWFLELVASRLTMSGCEVSFDELFEFIEEKHLEFRNITIPREPDGDPRKDAKTFIELRRTFVRQLDLLNANNAKVFSTAMLYARARTARQDWLDRSAISRQHLYDFNQELVDWWSLVFQSTLRHYTSEGSEPSALLEEAGWKILEKCEEQRARLGSETAPLYLVVGSYHMLSDNKDLGWHPLYEHLLTEEDEEDVA